MLIRPHSKSWLTKIVLASRPTHVASCTMFLDVLYALPVGILLLRGRGILLKEVSAPFSLGVFRAALNWISVLLVGVTSVVCTQNVPKKRIDTLTG